MQIALYAIGAIAFVYGVVRVWRLVNPPELPPAKDRPSAIKGPMAFTEVDGATDQEKNIAVHNLRVMKDSKKSSKASRLLRVFLCHSSNDKPTVRQLYHRLRSDGIDPWLDEENLLPGQDWQHEIPKAVRCNDVVVVCLSHGAVTKSGYIQKEISYALDIADEQPEGTIFLIPVKLEQCDIPDRLRRWHWVNLFEEYGYEKLMRALQVRANEVGAVLKSVST